MVTFRFIDFGVDLGTRQMVRVRSPNAAFKRTNHPALLPTAQYQNADWASVQK